MHTSFVIFCIIHSSIALFHHRSKPPVHTKTHVCLTPPNTMFKVQKNIKECEHEVQTNIFHEAFGLINEHAFHHPKGPHSIHSHDDATHDDFADRNFTLTEQEILKFFEENDHSSGTGHPENLHLGSSVGANDYDSIPESHLSHLHVPQYQPLHNIPLTNHPFPNQPFPNQQFPAWNHQFPTPDNLYKKTDSIEVNTAKPGHIQRLHKSTPTQSASTTKRNSYTYFNVKTDDSTKKSFKQRRSDETIHPTTASFKDKRIAGCLMHCLYQKDHAINPHTGYPTLDGLVHFYSDGVHEHGFFMTTLRAVDYCLKGASHKYHIHQHVKPDTGTSCDLAFDIFDCVSDKITEYCSHHHYHDAHFDFLHHKHHEHSHLPDHSIHHPDSHYEYFHEEGTEFIKK